MLASSTFLASAAATLPLQDAILSGSVRGAEDPAVSSATKIWTSLTQSLIPVEATKACVTPAVSTVYQQSFGGRYEHTDRCGQVRAAAAPHAEDWLHAPPNTALGLRLSDKALDYVWEAERANLSCLCGSIVDSQCLYG